MSVGTAVAIGLAVSAGASVAGSAVAAKGARTAAKTQAASAQQGFDYEREHARALQERLLPWQQLGQSAMGPLLQSAGIGGPAGGRLGGPPLAKAALPMGMAARPGALPPGPGLGGLGGGLFGQSGMAPPQPGLLRPPSPTLAGVAVPPWLGAGGARPRPPLRPGPPIQARAAGGPVAPGQPYLVGEQGPELFLPGQAGTITDAEQTRRAAFAQQRAQTAARAPQLGGGPAWGSPGGWTGPAWGSPGAWTGPAWGVPVGSGPSVGGPASGVLGSEGPMAGGAPAMTPTRAADGSQFWSAGHAAPAPFTGGRITGYDPGTGPRGAPPIDQTAAAAPQLTLAGLHRAARERLAGRRARSGRPVVPPVG